METKSVRILFLGQIGVGQTSLMRLNALRRLGHNVHGVHTTAAWGRVSWLRRRLERTAQRGGVVSEINRDVLDAAKQFRPELVWAEKQEFLRVETIQEMRNLGARVVHFTPDPYFFLDWKRTRLMDDAIGSFDALLYCKSYERAAYEALGRPAVYMPLGYCDETHRPLKSDDSRWSCKVGFLGGWEPRRQRLLHSIAATGVDLKVWGGYWEFLLDGPWTPRKHIILRQLAGDDPFVFSKDELLATAHQGGEVYADDYARALTGAQIGLGFLRKTCPDQHTTRTFEIPACGSMLLADRTPEHQAFFTEGEEAEFFDSEEELLEKVSFYVRNEPMRRRIAANGQRRSVTGQYAYIHRLRSALESLAVV